MDQGLVANGSYCCSLCEKTARAHSADATTAPGSGPGHARRVLAGRTPPAAELYANGSLPTTVSVDVNCTNMFLRVRITKKWQEGFGRRLARWLRLAHQTRGGEYRLGLTGALDEGMRCWLKRGFGGRSIVESMRMPSKNAILVI
eukprot:COSAG04_NODE_6465_length_1321_cov_6.988543_2_plen_145_part_00